MKTLTPQILGMYIGCKCNVTASEYYEEMKGATLQGLCIEDSSARIVPNGDVSLYEVDFADVTLILRPLSSMTEDDVKDWSEVTVNHTPYCVELDSTNPDGELTSVYSDGSILSRSKDDGELRPINGGKLFCLLLSKGFDLFDLIPSNLAIDSTTLK